MAGQSSSHIRREIKMIGDAFLVEYTNALYDVVPAPKSKERCKNKSDPRVRRKREASRLYVHTSQDRSE
jgi:hypothetical protein